VGVWHLMPKLMGGDRPVPWLCADDFGAVAARAFAEPDRFVGADLSLASDVRTIDECRVLWRSVFGRSPRGFPMPIWLFRRFVGDDLLVMWRWLRDRPVETDGAVTLEIVPSAKSVRDWLSSRAR
jgi:hypothetical protein